MLRLTFCDANTINHYLCDILPLLQLSCTSTYVNELEVFIVVGINIIVPSITISISYGLILFSIFHISSTEGRSKAFSTCSSHIIAVFLFFGSGAFMYLKPSSAMSMDEEDIFLSQENLEMMTEMYNINFKKIFGELEILLNKKQETTSISESYRDQRNNESHYRDQRNNESHYRDQRNNESHYRDQRNNESHYRDQRNNESHYRDQRNNESHYRDQRNNESHYRDQRNNESHYRDQRNNESHYRDQRNNESHYRDQRNNESHYRDQRNNESH
ncbi:hypothetical protein STEG23_037467 [Scotinomys teguina]